MLASVYTLANNATKRSLDDMSISSSTTASSISSVSSINSSAHSSCPNLLYILPQDLPSPKPCNITFHEDTLSKQAIVLPAELKDGEVQNIPERVIPCPPHMLQNPPTVQISSPSNPTFMDSSSSRSIPLQHSYPKGPITQVRPSESIGPHKLSIHQSLNLLYNALHAHYALGTNTPSPESATKDSEEEESNDEFNWCTTFPTPPHTPP